MYKYFLKRVLDLFASLIGMIILSPIFIIVYIALYFINNKSVFFYQVRPGFNEKIFKIIKFKTMRDMIEGDDPSTDFDRITKIGHFLRKSSLDEIPQLINVLKGDMSLVGPRPLLIQYLPIYKERERLRHTVRPGVTGYAQVNGRNTLDWGVRLEMDAEYVEKLSFILDIQILYKTFLNLIRNSDTMVISTRLDHLRIKKK